MKIGFIGGGNMASAMIGGILKNKVAAPEEIMVSVVTEKSVERLKNTFGVAACRDNRGVAAEADILFLAIKPIFVLDVIAEIKDFVKKDNVIVSVLPGRSMEWFCEQFGRPLKIVRTMPNTPALVGEGMTGVCKNELVSEEEMAQVLKLLNSFGRSELIPERLMNTVVGVSGSSPAYVFMFIEALADAAVAEGMPRKQAYAFAAQSVLGSAKMVLETGLHPGELKDQVCSPGGTTIEAVAVLEKEGMRSAVIDATRACIRKASGV